MGSSTTRSRGFLVLGIVFVALVILAVIMWRPSLFGTAKTPVVDFNTVAPSKHESATQKQNGEPLRVAVAAMISPKDTARLYTDLVQRIGERIGQRIVISQRKTYAEVNDLVERKDVDLAFVCSGPYVTGHAKFGMEILAVPVVDGKKTYHSYILAHRDSAIESLQDLKGRKFAFTDPHSNTGCLVPRYMLALSGESPETFFREFFFTYSHDNSIKAVAEGLCDGAAVDHLIWEYFHEKDPQYTSMTRIVAKSPPYGMPPVVVHPDLSPDMKRHLREAFLTLHEDPASHAIMQKLRIERFEQGDDESYDTVREMNRWLKERSVDHG